MNRIYFHPILVSDRTIGWLGLENRDEMRTPMGRFSFDTRGDVKSSDELGAIQGAVSIRIIIS